MAKRTLLLLNKKIINKKIINIMGTYLYNGHKVDLFIHLISGFVAYIDDDLTPQGIGDDVAFNIIENGVRI